MQPLRQATDDRLDPTVRDSVDGLSNADDEPPAIVSISDVHGYLEAARSALLTLHDSPEFDPVVVPDEDGVLHWADNDYVLVFNGDLVDRGPSIDGVLALVGRLLSEAPPGRVRVTLGNHEAIALSPDRFGFQNWYAGRVGDDDRSVLLDQIRTGRLVAAYRGHSVTYAHAGLAEEYSVTTVNESLIDAADELREALGTPDDVATQRRVIDEHPRVLGVGRGHLKGPGAGIAWLDFSHLPPDAPPQVVGHTRHDEPRRKGAVYCQNVVRNTLDDDGGEAVFVETPQTLSAVVRAADGGVAVTEFDGHTEEL